MNGTSDFTPLSLYTYSLKYRYMPERIIYFQKTLNETNYGKYNNRGMLDVMIKVCMWMLLAGNGPSV